jgi:hypothetical protein
VFEAALSIRSKTKAILAVSFPGVNHFPVFSRLFYTKLQNRPFQGPILYGLFVCKIFLVFFEKPLAKLFFMCYTSVAVKDSGTKYDMRL